MGILGVGSGGVEGWAVGIEGWVVGTEGWRERISAVGPGNRGMKMGNGRVGSDNLGDSCQSCW